MPLPGGPSDKLGNRYELRWVVLQLVELLTGRIESLRIETPGEDAVEFRCRLPSGGHEAYQAKRGRAGAGRWTISALADVLIGFRELLVKEPMLTCVFVSEHAAAELGELSERARASKNLAEFLQHFLGARTLVTSWNEVRTVWRTDEQTTWALLRRVKVATASESYLVDAVERPLDLLLDCPGSVGRGMLTQLALDSVHGELTAPAVSAYLLSQNIRIARRGDGDRLGTNVIPGPNGIRRTEELKRIHEAIAAGSSIVLIGGLSGMGKSTLAAQFASEWKVPVCWLDCDLVTTELEVLDHLGDYLKVEHSRPALADRIRAGRDTTSVLAKMAGKELASLRCLLVWDQFDGSAASQLRQLLTAISIQNGGSVHIVTSQGHIPLAGAARTTSVHLERLTATDERILFLSAFPEARLPDLEKAASITNGYPILINLLCGAAQSLDFHAAIEHLSPTRPQVAELIDTFFRDLRDEQRRCLVGLAWLGVPFSSAQLDALGASVGDLYELASRHLVMRQGVNHYRVHRVVVDLIEKSVTPGERRELHTAAAMFLKRLADPTWAEARAFVMHASSASLGALADEAARRLLNLALSKGNWMLAHEAATTIVTNAATGTPGPSTFYPHFILGKHARITGDAAEALKEYRHAEKQAPDSHAAEKVRYEQASVMVSLEREPEATSIYEALIETGTAEAKAESLIALGLLAARGGDIVAAESKIMEGRAVANAAGLRREEAEANQALGEIFADVGRNEDAIVYLRIAHSLRIGTDSSLGALDVYGWFHLMHRIATVERDLGDPEKTADAARATWRIACASNNLTWEAESAFAMCESSVLPHHPQVEEALTRLGATGGSPHRSSADRLRALHSLVLCAWTLDRFTLAFESMFDAIAISEESGIPSHTYAHYPRDGNESKVISANDEVFFLLLPAGLDPNGITELISDIMARRPELTQYIRMVVGIRPNDAKSDEE